MANKFSLLTHSSEVAASVSSFFQLSHVASKEVISKRI